MSQSATLIVNIGLDKYEFHVGSRSLREYLVSLGMNVPVNTENPVELITGRNTPVWMQEHLVAFIKAVGSIKFGFIISEMLHLVEFYGDGFEDNDINIHIETFD